MFARLSVLLITLLIVPVASRAQQYVLLGWNDLGMHCSNKDFSKMAVLPPYNTVTAQLILKQQGQLPQIVTAGYSVHYSIPGNTYSVGKTNFWTYAQQLFGLPQPLPPDIGLTGKGLTGTLDTSGNSFYVLGIPNTPFADDDLVHEKPYQLLHLVATNSSTGDTVATTDLVVPVSNEIGCVQSGCHSSEQSILNGHEDTTLVAPVLCASCHASNALGTVGIPEAKSLSFRIHDKHQFITPTGSITVCYKCHPGPNTQCLRDVMGRNQTNPLVCQNCHGTMAQVASSINAGRRPWLDEPKCGNSTCHGSTFAEEPGKLYRMSRGHGGLFCSSCHNSPHAILPTVQPNDNLQSIRLQGYAGALGDCMICHTTAPTAPGPHGRTYSAQVTAHIAVGQNWNMVSLPLTVSDARKSILFPTSISDAYTFLSPAGYVRRDTLQNGAGYWLKFPTSQTVDITGQSRSRDTIHVAAGWNMIGSTTFPVLTDSVLQLPPGNVLSAYYGFDQLSGYQPRTTIVPGLSYWVKVSQAGQLILGTGLGQRSAGH